MTSIERAEMVARVAQYTQNRKTVESVSLNEDGSANVTMSVKVDKGDIEYAFRVKDMEWD